MALSSPGSRLLLPGAILLLLFSSIPAAAQAPDAHGAFVAFALICPQSFAEVDYQSSIVITCQFHDLTRDSAALPGSAPTGAVQHITMLAPPKIYPTDAKGWQIIASRPFIASYGGDIIDVTFQISTTPQIDTSDVRFDIEANYTGPNDIRLNQTLSIAAQVNPYDIAHVETLTHTKVQTAGQFEVVKYVVAITNDGVFPDVYRVDVKAPIDFKISPPPSVYVPPRETRNVTVSVLTPHGKVWELGRSVSFDFKVTSTYGTGAYSTVGILKVQGPYVPAYWLPLTLVGLVSLGIATSKSRDRLERNRLEKGRPRPVQLAPRQRVLLAELKRTDVDAYKTRRVQLAAVYASRKESYRDAYREQRKRDAEERKLAKAEFVAAKARRKEEKKAEAKRLQLQKQMNKATEKALARETKKKEKELAKKTKLLEKARAKQAKRDAKQARKDAKAQALADKTAAREAKAAAKAAKKAGRKP